MKSKQIGSQTQAKEIKIETENKNYKNETPIINQPMLLTLTLFTSIPVFLFVIILCKQ